MSSLGRSGDRAGVDERADTRLDVRTDPRPEVGPDGRTDREAAPRRRLVVPGAVWLCVCVAVLMVAAAVGARVVMGGLPDLNPFKDGLVTKRTVDRSGPAVLKAITDLGTLQTASGYYEVVIDVEDDVEHVPSFLAGRRVLFVAAGTVDAGVDLTGLGSGAVTVDGARGAATLRLPAPRLSPPRLDLDRSYVYNEERGLADRIGDALSRSPEDQRRLYSLASQHLARAAAANGDLRGRAEANARSVLQGLLRPLGFTEVTVTFAG